MIPCHPTARGWTWMAMACAGGPPSPWPILTGVHTATADAGCGRIAAGTGIQITPGAGRRFTMAVGAAIRASDGSGCPAAFGDLHGLPGATRTVIAVGLRCHPVAAGAA